MWTVTNRRTGEIRSYATRREAERATMQELITRQCIVIDGIVQKNSDIYDFLEDGKRRGSMCKG